jgi:hypothetical protein
MSFAIKISKINYIFQALLQMQYVNTKYFGSVRILFLKRLLSIFVKM